MKPSYCKKIKCPRFDERGTHLYDIPLCRAQENADHIGNWFEPVEGITNEQCQRLRRLLKEKKEVQV